MSLDCGNCGCVIVEDDEEVCDGDDITCADCGSINSIGIDDGYGEGDATACEWCGTAPAARAVIGTLACPGCAAATARDRVIAALRRWSRR